MYILSETSTRVVIATMGSNNSKTGDMVQVWILHRNLSPRNAVNTGADRVVCGDCPHRGTTCYVRVDHAPRGIWQAYQRGRYQKLAIRDYPRVFAGRAVRLGAYGDPAFMPRRVVRALVSAAVGHTGYSHQWRRSEWLKPHVMASVDSLAEQHEARAAGWRTFRVSSGQNPEPWEILCPASKEAGNRTTCLDCQLCNGSAGSMDPRKSIYIPAHGVRASAFIQIEATR